MSRWGFHYQESIALIICTCALGAHALTRARLTHNSPLVCSYGSPAHFYNLKACRYIVEVNGQSVVDGLDAFLAAVKPLGDDAPVRLKTVDLQEQAIAYTLKTDYLFWPTRELTLDNALDDWRLISHQH